MLNNGLKLHRPVISQIHEKMYLCTRANEAWYLLRLIVLLQMATKNFQHTIQDHTIVREFPEDVLKLMALDR